MTDPLLSALDEAITRFHDDSRAHKRLHRTGQTAVIAMTALTTVAAGAGIVTPEAARPWLQFAVLLLSAATTAVTAWLELRKARELWQHEREVYHALCDLRREIDFETSVRPLTDEVRRDYFARVHGVLQSSTSRWRGLFEKRRDG